jgi:hypothetical protein
VAVGLFLELVRGAGGNVREVVLDADARGLRALVSITRGDDTDVVRLHAAGRRRAGARGRLPIYATADALATAQPASDSDGHDRLH